MRILKFQFRTLRDSTSFYTKHLANVKYYLNIFNLKFKIKKKIIFYSNKFLKEKLDNLICTYFNIFWNMNTHINSLKNLLKQISYDDIYLFYAIIQIDL